MPPRDITTGDGGTSVATHSLVMGGGQPCYNYQVLDNFYEVPMTSYLPGLEPTPAPEFQPPDRTPSSVRSAHTRRNYARAVRAFQAWCSERGVPAMPSSPDHISRYLRDLSVKGLRPASLRAAWAAIADAHRQADHKAVADSDSVKTTLSDLLSDDTRPQTQVRPLTEQDLAKIRAAASTPRRTSGLAPRLETPAAARQRGLVDVAVISVMRSGLLRRSEAAGLIWKDVTVAPDGTGQIRMHRSKADAKERDIPISAVSVADLQAIRPANAAGSDRVFQLSPSQIGRRVRAACIAANLGDGYAGGSCRLGMESDMNREYRQMNQR